VRACCQDIDSTTVSVRQILFRLLLCWCGYPPMGRGLAVLSDSKPPAVPATVSWFYADSLTPMILEAGYTGDGRCRRGELQAWCLLWVWYAVVRVIVGRVQLMHEVLTDEKVRKDYSTVFTAAKASSCTCNCDACGPPRVGTGQWGGCSASTRACLRTHSAATRTPFNPVEPDDTGELPRCAGNLQDFCPWKGMLSQKCWQ